MDTSSSAVGSPDGLVGASAEQSHQDEMLLRVGQMTRAFHENLRELGFDKLLHEASLDIPNMRDRLDHVAKMTEQAAQRVLNATEVASPLQAKIDSGAGVIAQGWNRVTEAPFSEENYREMVEKTLDYLDETRSAANATKEQLLEIMMAQDFQDLTGQVIKKVTVLAHSLEQQLIQILVDYVPQEARREVGAEVQPVAVPSDTLAGQEQVDDLLESLGF